MVREYSGLARRERGEAARGDRRSHIVWHSGILILCSCTVLYAIRTLNSLRCRTARTAVIVDDHDKRSDTRKTRMMRMRGRCCSPLLEDRKNIVAFGTYRPLFCASLLEKASKLYRSKQRLCSYTRNAFGGLQSCPIFVVEKDRWRNKVLNRVMAG